ncbi:hypothetical protein ACSSS7_000819 [Eimeria intestinalis]
MERGETARDVYGGSQDIDADVARAAVVPSDDDANAAAAPAADAAAAGGGVVMGGRFRDGSSSRIVSSL